MRNPIALTRLAGLTLALSLAASCGAKATSETEATPSSAESAPETPEDPAAQPADAGAMAEAGAKPDAGAMPEAGGAAEATEALATPPAADVSTWKVGDTIPSGIPGVKGIEILEVRQNGSGPVCGTGKSATVNYKAMLANGTVKDPGPTYTFQVGAGRVIKGWDLAIAKLRAGDSLVVAIPEGLAYPGQGDWKFEMELVSFR